MAQLQRTGLRSMDQGAPRYTTSSSSGTRRKSATLAVTRGRRSHGSALPQEAVEELVRRGLGHPRAAVRQAFYRAGRAFLGGDVLEWAPEDVLERARRDSGRRSGGSPQPRDPDQNNLF